MEKKFMDVKDFIVATGLSKAFVYKLINKGNIRAVRFGRRLLIPISEVEALLR